MRYSGGGGPKSGDEVVKNFVMDARSLARRMVCASRQAGWLVGWLAQSRPTTQHTTHHHQAS